jgi:glucose/arabinose dehydrogenase
MKTAAALLTILALGSAKGAAAQTLHLDRIELPPGFTISVFARVDQARSLAQADDGTVFVGTRGDKVYAVPDANGDGVGDRVYTIASGLNEPNGVAFHDGALFVGEIERVTRYADILRHLASPPRPTVVSAAFPSETHHGWKFIAFGPDGKLYVPVGAPCNVCRVDARHGALFRMNADGTGLETFASGIRNTVGFDWHPTTHELWFTDNGRDNLGDDTPPDELNRAPRAGLDFGFPKCFGRDVVDPTFGRGVDCASLQAPELELGPHVAALGMRFYTGTMFPAEYRDQIFIAEHGSWNRSTPIGYQVRLARRGADGRLTDASFASGWLAASGEAWGRPVDVLVARDGALLVSDDKAGAVYRIAYDAKRLNRRSAPSPTP